MSEVRLLILDEKRAIHGHIHASQANVAVAALAAEPQTIEELDLAMSRFDVEDKRQHFAHFHLGDSDEPWDAGLVVIDITARLIAYQSSYSSILSKGTIHCPKFDAEFNFRLFDDWEILHQTNLWRDAAEKRRELFLSCQRIDVRKVLYGRKLIEFIVEKIEQTRDLEANEAIKSIHAQWLMTPRDDLDGKCPRKLLLAHMDFLDFDLQYRQFQWSITHKPPVALERSSMAYKHAGFGRHENVLYYNLIRDLLSASRQWLESHGPWKRSDEVERLEKMRDASMASKSEELNGQSPSAIIENERQRIPEVGNFSDCAIDCDCPLCQMIMENKSLCFWHLDGCNMDDEFAFSFHRTEEEWNEEQRSQLEMDRKFNETWSPCQTDSLVSTGLWNPAFIDKEIPDDLPLSQMVAIANFDFAVMISKLNEDINELSDGEDTAQPQRFNTLLANLREALQSSPEHFEGTINQLVDELAHVAERYPDIRVRCADLMRLLREFPNKLSASAE